MAYRGTTVVMKPRRRSYRSRSPWPSMLVALAVIVAIAGVIGGVILLTGDDEGSVPASASASASASPCTTLLVMPAVLLPDPSEVKVNVFNSTKKSGLAAVTAAELQARGFVVKKVTNDPTGAQVKGVAEIRYGPAAEEGAKLVAFHFPGAKMVLVGRTGKRVDVALGAAFRTMPTAQDVNAALASPSPTASGPGCASPSTAASANPVASTNPAASTMPAPTPAAS